LAKCNSTGAAAKWAGRLVHETFVDQYVDDFFYPEFLREWVLRRSTPAAGAGKGPRAFASGSWTQEVIENSRMKTIGRRSKNVTSEFLPNPVSAPHPETAVPITP
jgi:hypothetical protein